MSILQEVFNIISDTELLGHERLEAQARVDSEEHAVNVLINVLLNHPIARYFHQYMNTNQPSVSAIKEWTIDNLLKYFDQHTDWLSQFSEKQHQLLKVHAFLVCQLLQHPSGMDDTGSWDRDYKRGLREYLGAKSWDDSKWKDFIIVALVVYEHLIGVPIANDAQSRQNISTATFEKKKRTVERVIKISLPPITTLHMFRGIYVGYAVRLPEEFYKKYQRKLHQDFLSLKWGDSISCEQRKL